MSSVKCSVIIPTFNREATIRKALQYFEDEFYLNGEVIVVDDASQDQTCALIEKDFSKVKLLKHSYNKGAAAARNTGIKNACGEYIAFLDSDDVWYPNKLSKQLSYFEVLDSTIGAVFSYYHDNKGIQQTRIFEAVEDWFQYFLKGCFISPGSGLVVRRSVFDKVGFFDETMRRLEDWDWLLRLSQHYSLNFINEPLFCVNYSGKPDPKVVLDSIEILKEKCLQYLDPRNVNIFMTTIIFEKLIATKGISWAFLRIFLLEVIFKINTLSTLLSRILFKK